MKKTCLFFLVSILLLVFGFVFDDIIPQWLYIPIYIAYIIFCIRIIEDLKIRFLSYPAIVLSLAMGFAFYLFDSNMPSFDGVAMGFVFMFFLAFIVLPVILAVFILGIIFDIKELKNKCNCKKEAEKTENE